MCVSERERKREKVCVCVCVSVLIMYLAVLLKVLCESHIYGDTAKTVIVVGKRSSDPGSNS